MPPIRAKDGKAETLRKQVVSKVHWGARREEIFEWLEEKHKITGLEADAIYAEALKARAREIRSRAVFWLVASGMFFVATVVYFFVQYKGHFVIVGWPVIILLSVGFSSIAVFFRNLVRLLSGKQEGPID